MWKEALAVTRLNVSSIPSRLGGSAIIVVGVGGVVAVLLGLLAMSTGFRAALAETARPDRALLVRNGSNGELDGWVSNEELAILESYDTLETVSGEIYVTVTVALRGEDTSADVVGRGVSGAAFTLRPELQIVAGRRFEPGTGEIIVGVQAAARYRGLEIGDELAARNATWTVVGHFSAGGTAVESEIWVDVNVAQDVFRRAGVVSVARVRLPDAATRTALTDRLDRDPRLPLTLVPETEFFAAQSADRAALINTFAYFIAGIMALGSVTAALNTMYTAVSRRTVEIATLRALGFGATGVVISVLVEAMLLATLGGIAGALLVYLAFDGYAATTFNNTSGAQVGFAFRVTPALVGVGLTWALVLGLVGGLLPAVRAARQPITRALRGE